MRQIAAHHYADHPAETAHLPPCQLMLRMTGQTGIDHPGDAWLLFQLGRNRQSVGAMPFYSQRQRLQTARRQETMEWTGDGADGVLQIAQPFR